MPSEKPKAVVPSSRAVAVRETPLINRAEEMRILRDSVDRAIKGGGQVLLLHGEAGIGKTRLARELGAYARSKGMQVLSGRCPTLFRIEGIPPYVLWREVIKNYMENCTLDELHKVIGSYPIEVSKLIPELKQKLRVVPEAFPLSPEHSRDRLFEAVSQFITNISKARPLLVILDDLQWTDQSSLLLLLYLARGIFRESLLLLGAYRDIDVDKEHPLLPVLAELNRERLSQSIPLGRLSFDDVNEMITRILDQDALSREFSELVFSKTRGNPFFVEELMKSLKEEKILFCKGERWEAKEVSEIKFPESIKEVIKARVDRLDDECQHVLKLASFIGKDFNFEVLKEASRFDENKLVELIENLLSLGLLKEREIRGEVLLSFSDVMVRDVVYEEISFLRRKRLHGLVGSAFEKIYSKNIDEHVGELASHFLESGDKVKALDYFLKAGEKAMEIYANSEAISYFESALKLLGEKKEELQRRGLVLEKLGELNANTSAETAIEHWKSALQLWEQQNEKEKILRLDRKIANAYWYHLSWKKVHIAEAEKHHKKALKIGESMPENLELANLYEDIARKHYMNGDPKAALPWAEKAVKIAEKLRNSEALARSYTTLGTIFFLIGSVAKKPIKYLEEALRISLENDHLEIAPRIYVNLAAIVPSNEVERRFEFFKRGFELSKKIGLIGVNCWLGCDLSGIYSDKGDLKNAFLFAKGSVAVARKTGNLAWLGKPARMLGKAYHLSGEWIKAEQLYKEAFTFSQELNSPEEMFLSLQFLGELYFDKKEYSKSKEFYEKASKLIKKSGYEPFVKFLKKPISRLYIEIGEIEKAENLINDLQDFALKVRDKGLIADTKILRGIAFRSQKKWKESILHFEEGLKEHQVLGARQWGVYNFAKFVLCEFTRVYLERDMKGDREKAFNLLNQALEVFQKMGAKKEIEKIQKLMGYEHKKVEPEIPILEHLSTGYLGLDDLLIGGLPRNHAVLLTSPSCDERDLLIKKFLEKGAEENQTTFYVTTKISGIETLAKKFQQAFYPFVCNPQAGKIIKDNPNSSVLKGVENLTDINIALFSTFRKLKSVKGAKRACIEIVSDVLLQHHTVQTRRWLNALIPELKANGFTTLAVFNPEMHSPQEISAVLDLFDGEISIRKKGAEKLLKIEKMTDKKYLKNEISLKIDDLQPKED